MRYAACFAAGLLAILSARGIAADLRADLDRLAEHLKALGFEVHTGIAHTGIVAVLNLTVDYLESTQTR